MLKVIWTISFLLISQLSWATNQVIVARSRESFNTTTTKYIAPMCGSTVSGGCPLETTRTLAEGIMPTNGTLERLAIEIVTAPGTGKSWTFTLWINGSASSSTCAISGASALTCSDLTNVPSITAGQPFALEIVPSGTPTANTGLKYSFVFNSTTAGESVYVWAAQTGSNLNTSGNVRYTGPFSASSWGAGDTSRLMSPTSGTFKKFYIRTEGAPDNGAGTQTYTFTVRKNGADGSISCAISETATTCSDTSNTISMVSSDTLSIKHAASGTPVTTQAAGGITFAATTVGEFILPAVMGTNSTAQMYGSMYFTSVLTGESNFDALAGTGFTVTDMYVGLSSATDVDGTLTFTLREELATPETGPACTVGTASSTCTNSTDITITAGNSYDNLSTPTTTPGAPAAWIGYLGYIAPTAAARRVFTVM